MTMSSQPVRAPWPAVISVPLRLVYGIYAALVFLAVALAALVLVILLPSLRWRHGTCGAQLMNPKEPRGGRWRCSAIA